MARKGVLDDRLWKAAPDTARRLISKGFVQASVSKHGPADAWTTWNEKLLCFDVTFLESRLEVMPNKVLRHLWRHELGHIVGGHFKLECFGADALTVTDSVVHYYMSEDGSYQELRDYYLEQGVGIVDPAETLAGLGLEYQEYPLTVLHDLAHKDEDEEGSGGDATEHQVCGGIEGTSSNAATAVQAVARSVAAEDPDMEYVGSSNQHSPGMTFDDVSTTLPGWVGAAASFARSIVESVLDEGRSHKRPVEVYTSVGLHVPATRPTWRDVPDTVCFVVDTSGSMSYDLKYVAPVVKYLVDHGLTVRLIAGDTAVTMDEEIKGRAPDIEVIGGGGTEITPLFERAATYQPKAMVVFSDGYMEFPPDPHVDVLWVGVADGVDVPYGRDVRSA